MVEQVLDRKITENPVGYSGKLMGRLKSVFDSSQLIAVGGDNAGRQLKSRHFMDRLPTPPLTASMSPLELSEFNVAFPMVVGDLLFAKGALRSEGYVSGLGGCDYGSLPQIAFDLAKAKSADGMVIRVVQGATEEMPLRALSYMLPSLTLMEQLQRDGIAPPQLQMIAASNISGRLDRLDMGKVFSEAKRFAQVAQNYVETFFPGLEQYVSFLQDTPLDKDSVLRNQLLYIASAIKSQASSSLEESLKAKGVNNGARRTYRFYGGAHLVMHDASFSPIPQPLIDCPQAVSDTRVVISMGGKQEELFYKLRQEIKPLLGEDYRRVVTLQYLTNHHVPPYYMARGGDASLEDALHNSVSTNSIAAAARHDLDYLYKVSSQRGDFTEFLEKHRRTA